MPRVAHARAAEKIARAIDRAVTEAIEDPRKQFSWMFPPSTVGMPQSGTVTDRRQLSHGVGGMVHLFVDDGELVDAMRANALRRVLCLGNGISQEPRALAWAGFEVTALDISPLDIRLAADIGAETGGR